MHWFQFEIWDDADDSAGPGWYARIGSNQIGSKMIGPYKDHDGVLDALKVEIQQRIERSK